MEGARHPDSPLDLLVGWRVTTACPEPLDRDSEHAAVSAEGGHLRVVGVVGLDLRGQVLGSPRQPIELAPAQIGHDGARGAQPVADGGARREEDLAHASQDWR